MSARDDTRAGDLKGIYIESGISHRTREPFCRVAVQFTDRRGKVQEVVGQLPPAEVRGMALGWLEAAEAALHDASVFTLMVSEIGLEEAQAARFVAALREHRADAAQMREKPEADE